MKLLKNQTENKFYTWQPIETFPGDAPYWESEGTRHYNKVLVYGRIWEPNGSYMPDSPDSPESGHWGNDWEIALASTWTGSPYFVYGPLDYEVYIKPTTWMPILPPDPQ